MRNITRAAVAALSAVLVACGGGGGDDPAPAAAAPQAKKLQGTMGNVAGQITPDPATPAQSLQLAFSATFTGQVEPIASTFNAQFIVTREGAQLRTGTITFYLTTGQPGSGTYSGSASLTLPPDTVGDHVYCVRLNPAADWAVQGAVQEPQCTSVRVNAL
jgi:hypothetical protein